MTYYQAYIMGQDGSFIGADEIDCDNDKEAIVAARALIGLHHVELQESDRRIACFLPMQPSRVHSKA